MIDKPLVSVVIATYNMAEYLPLAIQSALDQSYGNVEIVVVDDGSTDATLQAVEVLRSNSRVRYLVQKNAGQAAAKNRGVRESSGQYVAFLDADDIWVPDKLGLQMPLFARSARVGVVYSRLAYIDKNGDARGVASYELYRGRVTSQLFISNFVGFGTSVVRKECFDRLGSFRESLGMGIDYDLWLRFSTQYEFDYVDRPLLLYREWDGQMSRNCRRRYVNGIETMERFLAENPGIVDKDIKDRAWAHTFVGFGDCLRQLNPEIRPALRLYFRALKHKLSYLPAWKAIVATVLGVR